MNELKQRVEVPIERKWNLSDIISDEKEFENIFNDCKQKINNISKYKNNLNKDNAIDCLQEETEISIAIEKLYVFSHMKGDEDTSDNFYIELLEKCKMLSVEASSITSFINPELAKLKMSVLEEMISNPMYKDFDFYLKDLIRNKKHLLSAKEEKILTNISMFSGNFGNIFQVFDNADLKFDSVKVDGEMVAMSHGMYSVLLQNKNQEVRRDAFNSIYKQYKAFKNTIAANYCGDVNKDVFYANTRKFSSALESALSSENINKKVYENLINSVDSNLKPLHRYVKLRKKALRLKENHMYDMYVPIVKDVDKFYDYDEAFELITKALKPLGEEYLNVFKEAKKQGWIDVEETKNKRSGAYSWGTYGVHPYVLLNHQGTMHDVFTIAHEMGHAMHTFYSNTNQCYTKSHYEIFVAEIASTVNEVMLIKYLLEKETGDMKKYLLSYYLDMFRTTLFRQTMFAEFEKFAHESVENGQPLSSDRLSDFYYELNKKYYGEGVIHDDYIRYEWARIPHFYNSFYVYKYATGITCAINIVQNILSYGNEYKNKYIDFLKSGGSDYPLNLLKIVDIDLTKKKPFIVAMSEFNNILKALERTGK